MAFDDEQLRVEVHAEFEGRDVFDRNSLGEDGGFQVDYPQSQYDGHVNKRFMKLKNERLLRKIDRENTAKRVAPAPIVECGSSQVLCPKCGRNAELREGSAYAMHLPITTGQCGGFMIKEMNK